MFYNTVHTELTLKLDKSVTYKNALQYNFFCPQFII